MYEPHNCEPIPIVAINENATMEGNEYLTPVFWLTISIMIPLTKVTKGKIFENHARIDPNNFPATPKSIEPSIARFPYLEYKNHNAATPNDPIRTPVSSPSIFYYIKCNMFFLTKPITDINEHILKQ